jgi:hypothetical protein
MKKTGSHIIRGFVRKAINEALAPEESFTTPIKGEKISLYREQSYEKFKSLILSDEEEIDEVLNPSSAKVDWSLDLDLRDWGIKDMTISIKNVVVNVDVASEGEAGYQSITINAVEEGFNIVNELKFEQNSAIMPYEIEVDFSSKEVRIM